MDILYKHPAPQTYRLIENETIIIPYWITPTINRYGIDPIDIYDADKMRDKIALNDISLLNKLFWFDFGADIKWVNKDTLPTLHLGTSTRSVHNFSQKPSVQAENGDCIVEIANRLSISNTVDKPRDEIVSLLRIPDEQYQSLRSNQSFYKIELTSNNFILITIEAGFLNVLEAREDAKQFFSDYLKARYTCETIHEVSKTNLFEWYLASLA